MPNKRNGIYRRKPKLDLHGMYSEDGQSFGFGNKEMAPVPPRQHDVETLKAVHFLLDVFPNIDVEIIQDVVREYNGNLEECTRKLQEICDVGSNKTNDKKPDTDLAIIACSLLADESQPSGSSTLDIYDSPEDFSHDLGCCSESEIYHSDYEISDINYSLIPDVHQLSNSDYSREYLSPDSDYRSNESSNVHVQSMNGGLGWSEQTVLQQFEYNESYKGGVNKNMTAIIPDELTSSLESSDPLKGKDDSKQKSNILKYLHSFDNLSISDNNIDLSPDNDKPAGFNGEIYFAHDNQISGKFSFDDTIKGMNRNSDSIMDYENAKLDVSPDLPNFLNKLNGLSINTLSKAYQEWDTFYSSLEPENIYNNFSNIVQNIDEFKQFTAEKLSVAKMDGYQPDISMTSSEKKVDNNIEKVTSVSSIPYSHNSVAKEANSHVDNNIAFQTSEEVSLSETAIKPQCSLKTRVSSTGNSSGSNCAINEDESEEDKKNSPSIQLLPSAASDFIPRPLAKRHSKQLARSKTAQAKSALRSNNSGNAKAESTSLISNSDSDQSIHPLRSGKFTSSSKTSVPNKISANADPQKVIDPIDPLGWNDVLSVNATSLKDSKPQRLNKVRKAPKDKSSQLAAQPPAFCPWQTFDVSESYSLNASRVSSLKVKPQELPVERSQTFLNSGANTLSLLHEATNHESTSDCGSSNAKGEDSIPPKLSDSPIGVRHPPSQISKTVPATVQPEVNFDSSKIINVPSSCISTKNVDLTPEKRTQNPPSDCVQSHLIKNKLQLRGVKTPVGIIRRYILEKQPVMVILRGLPGSGKSYLAKQLIAESQQMGVQGVILSTDDYFMISGQYCFNPNLLPEAHDWNKTRALQGMKESRSPIIIDNTNTTLWELLPYSVLALEHSYDVQIFEPDTSWRMKVAELARKNSHGVKKENIRRMKDRWENVSLDDVLKQASHSIATRKSHIVLPGNVTTVTPSPIRQPKQPMDKQPMDIQMNNNEPVPVTEATQQISTNGNTISHDLGLDNWFDTPTEQSRRMKKHEMPAKPSDKSPLRGITEDFLNQSLEKAFVNIRLTSPSPSGNPPANIDTPQTKSLTERRLFNNSVSGVKVIKEGHLSSDESWNSESETPTADKSLKLAEHFSDDVQNKVQDEIVTVGTSDISSDLLLQLRKSEVLDESSVLSNSCSTSGSYHTLASNSDVSSYHTVDNDDADYEEMISTDFLAGDDFEDVDPIFMPHAHLSLYKPQNGDVGVELLPVSFDGINFHSVGDRFLEQHGSGKSNYHKNRGLDYNCTDSTLHTNCKDPSERTCTKQTLSFPTKLLSGLEQSSSPFVAEFLDDVDSEKDSASGSFTQKLKGGCVLPNKSLPLSLVDYSGSDDSDTESPLPNDEQLVSFQEQTELRLNGLSAHKQNVLGNMDSNGGQVEAAIYTQNIQESPRTYVREISIDRSTQSSEDSVMSGREASPQVDNQLISSAVQQKKKKKRVRKGRNSEPFIEDSLKAKSKTQNWSSFVVSSSASSNSSGDSVVLENPIPDTCSSSTQTDPYIFSIVHKLNSPAFNSLQPLELNLSGVEVITSLSQSAVPERWSSTSGGNDTFIFRKVGNTADHSTITDETLEKEEVNLETLQSCFPEYSRKQLEATLAICHNDLEWVTSHLLDSPALYDMEDDDDDEEAMRSNSIKSEKDSLSLGSVKNAVKSLADICTTLVRNTNKVDADDLEMQMIQVGEGRLQKIEMFGRSRLHSLSEDLGNQDYWPDDFVLDDFPLPWSVQDLNKMQPDLIQNQPTLFRTSHFDSESVSRKGDLPTTLRKNKDFPSFTIKSSPSQEKDMHGYSSIPNGNDPLSSSLSVELNETMAVSKAKGEVSHPVAGQSQLIMPLDFVKHLESLYGPLDLQMENEGLALDDATARKIYNCLKLKAAKKVVINSNEQQLKKDEALARALQDEENSSKSATLSSTSAGKGQAANRVPGWTNEHPSWMTHGKDNVNGVNVSVDMSGETVRPNSVADTLHQLRGTQRSRVRAYKFQKKMPGSVKSVWYSARRRGQADSLVSIMEEEMAREEQQREQLRIIESTGDMEALATRIKRIELSNLFPSMGPDILEDIFRSTGFSKEETIRVLQESYNIPPAPMSKDKEDILNQLRKSQQDFHHVEDLYEDEVYNEDSGMTYDSLRNEAVFCRQLATDCQQQAIRYQSTGMQGAALFYRQRAKKYKENERAANFKAAQLLFDKGSERLQVENTLDLHFYRLDEAINAVNVAIDMKEDEYRKKPDKRNAHLDIVTGWGRNSKDGKPKLKPAIINHLWTRCFQYEERSPGMLRVYIGKRLVA